MTFLAEGLPGGWANASLGECCQIIAGVGFPKHLQGKPDEEVPVFKVGDISKAWQAGVRYLDQSPNTVSLETARQMSKHLLPPTTTVFAKIGAAIALNRRAMLARPSLVDNNVMGLYPRPDCLDARFLFYFTCTQTLNEYSRATTVPSIRKGDVAGIEFGLPPLPEQDRVVEAIETQLTRIDAAVESLKRVQANLERYRASVLKSAVEGRLVPTEAELARQEGRDYEPATVLLERILIERRRRWEEAELAKMKAKGKEPKDDKWKAKYKEPVEPDTSGLPELREGWCWATLEALTSSVRVICYGILMPKAHIPNGVPYVKVRDMKTGVLDVASLPRTDPAIAAKYERASLKGGDLLVAIRGTYGRVVEVPPDLEGGNITQDTARLALHPSLSRRFVKAVLVSPGVQVFFKRVARGVAVKGVNIGDLRLTPVALAPFAEQERIAEVVEDLLSVADEVIKEVALDLIRCLRLRQSILKWAFEGKLVDQDPEDEPAAALLDRIRVVGRKELTTG